MKDRVNIFDTISFLIITATTFLLPIFFLPATIVGFAQVKISLLSIGTILALIFFIIERIHQGSWSITLRPIYIFFIALPIVYLVSSYSGVNVHKSLIGGLFEQDTFHVFGILMLYAFLVASLSRTPKRIGVLALSLIASIFVVILFQAIRIIGGDMFSLGIIASPAVTLVGKWNDLTILSIIFLASILVALETIELKKWVAWTLLLLLVVPFILISLSTLAFDLYFVGVSLPICIGILSLIFFAYIFSIGRSKNISIEENLSQKKNNLALLPSLFVLIFAVVLVFFNGPINEFMATKTGVIYSEGRPTWQSTYQIAEKVLIQRPFLGSGPNSFAYEWNMNKPVGVNNFAFWNTDFDFGIGTIPSAFITVGLVGAILLILFYITILMMASRALMNEKYGGTILSIRMFVPFGVIFTTLMMILYNPGFVVVTIHFLFIGLLLGLDARVAKEKKIIFNKTQWSHFASTFVTLLILVGVAYWGYVIVGKGVANFYANKAVSKSRSEDEMIDSINRALRLDASQASYYEVAAQAYASKVGKIASLSNGESEAKKDELKNSLVSAMNYSNVAEKVDTTDYRVVLATGRILEYFGSLGVPGANEQAIIKYIAASTLSPSNPLPFIFASNVALTMNKKDLSKEYLIQALTLKSNYSDVPVLEQGITDLIQRLNKAGSVSVDIDSTDTSSTDSKATKPSAKK